MAITRTYSTSIPLRAIILLFLSGFNSSLAQTGLISPVIGPALPSGSFGELRGNHFHSGIDFKTGGFEGLPVRATDEGFVSRIKVSPGGYGLALYITHPSGITTVYGHLSGFYDAVADTVQQSQNLRKKFDTEIFPAPGRFTVKRGQIIGFSGNTGSSKGPHLHFETRHSQSEKPFNPVLSGVGYADSIPPVIHAVFLYKPGVFGWLHGSSSAAAIWSESNLVSDSFFVGIEYSDKANGSDSRLGVSSIQILLNGSVVCALKIDSFSFDLTSQIRAMSDPKRPGSLVCLKLPGNTLPFFVTGNGLISLPKGSEGLLEIRVTDPAGNTSTRQFQLKSELTSPLPAHVELGPWVTSEQLFEPFAVDVTVEGKKIRKKLNISPSDAIFKSQVSFRFEKLKKLKTDPSKLVGVRLDQSGNRTTVPVTVLDGFVYIKSQSGGTYGLDTDTSSPEAAMLTFKGYDFRGNLVYECPYSDDLSGLQESEVQINGKWVLSGYHTNRDVVFIVIDPSVPLTDAMVTLRLTDRCGNTSVTSYKIQNQTEITQQ